MRLFKADFLRFFIIGFVTGTLLVAGTIGLGAHGAFSRDVMPAAVAAQAQ